MMKKHLFLFVFLVLNISFAYPQKAQLENLNTHISILTSDSMQGRRPGLDGDKMAAEYIRKEFQKIRVSLLGEEGFSYFEVVTSVKAGAKNQFMYMEKNYELGVDYTPITFSKNDALHANIYFAGYGFDIDTDSLKWNDYPTTFHVNRMWVIVIRGVPDPNNPNSKYAPYASDWAKIAKAKDKGAKGVILVSPKNLEPKDELLPIYLDQQAGTSAIPVINIRRAVANEMLWNYGINIEEIENNAAKKMEYKGTLIPNKLAAITDLDITRSATQNVIGIIDGTDPVLKNEFIVIGAHYDHLGYGGYGSSSRSPDTIAIHPGADDNASGVAVMLDLAKRLQANKSKLKKSVVFVAFGAEELGIIGSKEFIKAALINPTKIKTMINLDMVGRLNEEQRLQIGGTGTALEFDEYIDNVNKKYKLLIQKNPDGYGPSDHSSFYSEKIPVLFLSTGAHQDYHTIFDTEDKINYLGVAKISNFTYDFVYPLLSKNMAVTYIELPAPVSKQGHGRLKVTLGIIPDVSGGDQKGLRIDGVRKGGVADLAGLIKGDIIVAIDGKPIGNIYDYMARMSALIPGKTATIDYIRSEKTEVTIVQL
ncbi:MAG: M20/M25/M40 family metallo-hydrolase [Bacteroidales bacterium]|nr:M20/M25/M40 family metallo-hydrolase [Bacteroidales bacterium]